MDFYLQVFDSLLNGDIDPYPSFFQNATGCTNYFNYMTCQVLGNANKAQGCMCDFLRAGTSLNFTFVFTTGARRPGVLLPVCHSTSSETCHPRGEPDVPRRLRGGETPGAGCYEEHQTVVGCSYGQLQGEQWRIVHSSLSVLHHKFRVVWIYLFSIPCLFLYVQVLIYSGQLDVIVAAPLTERFLPTVNWTGAVEYKTAARYHWKVQPSDTEVAGYVRQVKEFFQVSRYPRQYEKSFTQVCFQVFCFPP